MQLEAWKSTHFGISSIFELILEMSSLFAAELKTQRLILDFDILTLLSIQKLNLRFNKDLKRVMSLNFIMLLCLKTENIKLEVLRLLDLSQRLLMTSLLNSILSKCKTLIFLKNKLIQHMCMKFICLNLRIPTFIKCS